MLCAFCWTNEGRYACENGKLACGLCAVATGKRHVRLSDAPELEEQVAATDATLAEIEGEEREVLAERFRSYFARQDPASLQGGPKPG